MHRTVAIVGAGGKMGARAAKKIGLRSIYRVLMCEKDEAKAQRLEDQGLSVTELETALRQADFVVLAVPDAAIGAIAHAVVPEMRMGGTLIMLDAAAAYIGEIPSRDGITQMIAHPCHPPFFEQQPSPEEQQDYFGGIAAQDLLASLIEGSEEAFIEGTELCQAIFGPVRNTHRVSPEQFALLEPAMAEIVVATAAKLMKDSLDLAIECGVPAEAARAFMAGHARIALAIVFGAEKAPFSDAAKIAIDWGTNEIIRSDWKRVFERATLEQAIHAMLHPHEQAKK